MVEQLKEYTELKKEVSNIQDMDKKIEMAKRIEYLKTKVVVDIKNIMFALGISIITLDRGI